MKDKFMRKFLIICMFIICLAFVVDMYFTIVNDISKNATTGKYILDILINVVIYPACFAVLLFIYKKRTISKK